MTITGINAAFGVSVKFSTAEITNLPADTIAVRRRLRNDEFAVAFIKTKSTVEKWVLAPDGDKLKLAILQGINVKPKP